MTTASARIRVDMILPTLSVGGMETLTVRMARALIDRGFDVRITALESLGPIADTARELEVPISLVPTPGVVTNLHAPDLIQHFASTRPHVVHSHNSVWLKSARAARAAGVRGIVHTFHGVVQNEPWYIQQMRRLAALSSTDIVAVSDSLRELLIDKAGVRPDRIHVIINGVNTERFRPARGDEQAQARTAYGISHDSFLVGHVARLDSIKNQPMLLRGFAQLLPHVPNADLVIVGDGPARAELEQLTSSLGIGARVRFLGSVAEPAPLYRTFDAFVLSSVLEGTSMSILEAMASGTAVVATAVGGTPPLLHGGHTGMLIPSNDHEALGTALVRLARQPEERRLLATRGRERVESLFSESAMVAQYAEIYARYAGDA